MNINKINALLLEDDEVLGPLLANSLNKKGLRCQLCNTIANLKEVIKNEHFTVFILDLRIGNEHSLPLIPLLRRQFPDCKILIVTGFASIATTVEAIKSGADDYLPKPVNANSIIEKLCGQNDKEASQEIPQTSLSLERMEWEHIQQVLQKHDGNISATARELNMHRRSLQRKLLKKPPAC